MKYGSVGCRWSTGRGANPIWEKKVSPLALQSIAITSSQYVKGNMLFGLWRVVWKHPVRGKQMKTCIFPSWLCPCSSYFLPSPSLISSWALTPHELHRMLALNRWLGKSLKMPVSCQVMGGSGEGKGTHKTAKARDRQAQRAQTLILIRPLSWDVAFGILYLPPLHPKAKVTLVFDDNFCSVVTSIKLHV